jgi:simple sugar transport system permease protein
MVALSLPLPASPFALFRRNVVFLLLAAMLVGFSLAEPAFSSAGNLMSVLQAVAVVAILGIGVSLSMAVGGFDLSVGAVAASSVMTASYAMVVWHLGAAETILLVLGFGLLVGLANALLIIVLRVPDMLATLAMNFLLTGLQLIPAAGRSIATGMILPDGGSATGKFDPAFLALGRARLFDLIPVPVVLTLAVVVVFYVLTEHTRLGRLFFAIGGNELASRMAGVRVRALRLWAYVASAMLASVGGAVVAARIGRGDVSSGASLLLDAVAASLIAFAVLDARRPNVLGMAVGALFVGVLLNGLTMLNAPYYTQDFVKGAVLAGALALTYGFERKS